MLLSKAVVALDNLNVVKTEKAKKSFAELFTN